MIQILPIASSLHRQDSAKNVIEQSGKWLNENNIDHVFLEHGQTPRSEYPIAIFVVTGGTERQVIDLVLQNTSHYKGSIPKWKTDEPVLLMAHQFQNSLPSCLEIVAHLDQMDRKGKILLLNGTVQSAIDIKNTLAAVKARYMLSNERIGRIGEPSEWLIASMPEMSAVRDVWNLDVVDVSMEEFLHRCQKSNMEEATELGKQFEKKATGIVEPNRDDLQWSAKVLLGMQEIIRERNLKAISVRCFDLVTKLKATGCLAVSELLDSGFIAGCEGDIPSTITMLLMQSITEQIPFMANPQDIERETNSLWISHCTIARKLLKHHRLRSHFESSLGAAIEGPMEPGPVTLARIGGHKLSKLFVTNGHIVENGNSEHRCRTQFKISIEENVDYFLSHPLGNHHVMIKGHFADSIRLYSELYFTE